MTFAWQSLLPEIRNIILKQLARDDTTAIYASVCKEWRSFFGKRNLSHLKIPPSDLDFLDQLSKESTRQVDHIWLNIELKRYTCRICRKNWESYMVLLERSDHSRSSGKVVLSPSEVGSQPTLDVGAQRILSKRLGTLVQDMLFWRPWGRKVRHYPKAQGHSRSPTRVGARRRCRAPYR